MTPKKELEAMIIQFKVSDLQSLLNFAGQNSKGRKSDLQRKVQHLIRHNISIPIEMKIRTMYRQMLSEAQKSPPDNYYYGNNNYESRYGYYSSNPGYAVSSAPAGVASYESYDAKNYYQNHNPYYNECLRKNNHLYTPIMHDSSPNLESSTSTPFFDYSSFLESDTNIPDMRSLRDFKFKNLSFYRYDQTIVPLMPMKPQHKFTDVFDYVHSFTVSEQAHNLLTWPKKNEQESRFQLQLRICVLDEVSMSNPSEIADSLPLALTVKVNDKNCQLPPAIPSTNKQGMLLKRMNAPINITCQSSKRNQVNTLAVNWSVECNKLYGLTVHLVEKYTSDELIEKLKAKQRGPELTQKYIHEKLDEDDDIAATSLKVSLVCPLGKVLMSLPARATTCNHVQCFDASLYIKMNEVKSVWQCPICNQSCFYEDLFIDGYFVDILRSGKFSSAVNEVQINNDGTWEPVGVRKRKISDTESEEQKRGRFCDENSDKPVKAVSENSPVDNTSKEADDIHRKHNGVTLTPIYSPRLPQEMDLIPPLETAVNTLQLSQDLDPCPTPPLDCSKNSLSLYDARADYGYESSAACDLNRENYTQEDAASNSEKVMLVDLTSDAESEECSSPLNLKKIVVPDPSPEEPCSSSSFPPIYDIDDSDELLAW